MSDTCSECEREAQQDGLCWECHDPMAYDPAIDPPGTRKSRERMNKEKHVW